MLGTQPCVGQFYIHYRVFLNQRRFTNRIPGASEGGVADGKEEKVNHVGREEDEDPGVDDGVDGDEAEPGQVQDVRFLVFG